MLNKKTLIVTLIIGTAVMLIVAVYAFFIFNSIPDLKESDLSGLIGNAEIEEVKKKTTDDEYVAASTEDKITPSTKIVYQYYYTEDGIMEEQDDVPYYFLLGLTLNDMIKYYPDWEIVTFSSEKVVMRKNITGNSSQHYVIGEKDGYIAVFYEEEQDGINLKELTDVPVISLPEDEQMKLKEGIRITGEDKLAEAIQNYES